MRTAGLAAARNTGIEASTAPIVAFTDDDCVPRRGLARGAARAVRPARRGGGRGPGRGTAPRDARPPVPGRDRPVWLRSRSSSASSSSLAYRAKLYLRAQLAHRRARVPGPGRCTRSSAPTCRSGATHWSRSGCSTPRITFGGEDEDICRRLRERPAAEHFLFTSRAVIAHDFDGELRDTLRRSYQYGAGSARGYLKNDDQGPTIFPVPALVAALTLLGLRRHWALAAAVAVPLLVFSRWPVAGGPDRRAELLAFPAVQLFEETAHDLGFAKSWLRLRREYRRRPTRAGTGGERHDARAAHLAFVDGADVDLARQLTDRTRRDRRQAARRAYVENLVPTFVAARGVRRRGRAQPLPRRARLLARVPAPDAGRAARRHVPRPTRERCGPARARRRGQRRLPHGRPRSRPAWCSRASGWRSRWPAARWSSSSTKCSGC